jgi:hypothetical protein|tara:strand:- start:789 stop:1043 length:255 start_codon:yes stop_codon:yes gene_type:complete
MEMKDAAGFVHLNSTDLMIQRDVVNDGLLVLEEDFRAGDSFFSHLDARGVGGFEETYFDPSLMTNWKTMWLREIDCAMIWVRLQ